MRAMDSCTGFVLWDTVPGTLHISYYGMGTVMGPDIILNFSNKFKSDIRHDCRAAQRATLRQIVRMETINFFAKRIKVNMSERPGLIKPPNAPFKSPVKPCAIPVKDSDLERILEKLDLILKGVGQLADHIAERLGIDLTDVDTDEEEDSNEL